MTKGESSLATHVNNATICTPDSRFAPQGVVLITLLKYHVKHHWWQRNCPLE